MFVFVELVYLKMKHCGRLSCCSMWYALSAEEKMWGGREEQRRPVELRYNWLTWKKERHTLCNTDTSLGWATEDKVTAKQWNHAEYRFLCVCVFSGLTLTLAIYFNPDISLHQHLSKYKGPNVILIITRGEIVSCQRSWTTHTLELCCKNAVKLIKSSLKVYFGTCRLSLKHFLPYFYLKQTFINHVNMSHVIIKY